MAISTAPPPAPARSAARFCAIQDEYKASYLAAFDSANNSVNGGDMLTGVLQAGVAVGDLSSMWTKLADAAPEEIRVDVQVVSDSWDKQTALAADILDHPLKGLSSALLGSFKLAGPLTRIDGFIRGHCDG